MKMSSNSIGEIFKQTSDMVKTIKLRNKLNENKNNFNKKILNNIVIEDKTHNKNKEDMNNSEIIKKKNKTINKFNSKSKSYVSLSIGNKNNSLPIIIGNNDTGNFNSEKSKKSNENKNIFNYNKTNTSNNIIKIKENKENSLFSSLKRSSENSSNFKFCISLFNKDKKNFNKDNNQDSNNNK